MSDLQILIENIRKSISFPETVSPNQMQVYASHYAESCTELSNRMIQCAQQIRTGNITEGIRLAELKPNLTALYLSLDIPEWEEWNEIVSTLGFDVPPPLPVELSKELNEAYLKMSAIEPLLRMHRLHALNGSSIRERLAIIRSIAKKDIENIFWTEDQEKFEKARIKELKKEVQHAIESKDYPAVRSLHAELRASDWLLPPPDEYRGNLVESLLQNYADILMEKFSIFEYDEASDIYSTMQRILASELMNMPLAVGQLIRPAVLWLHETQRQNAMQHKFLRAVADLVHALENDASLPELERLYYVLGNAATQAAMDIPVELEELYQSIVSQHHIRATRKNQLAVALIITACLLLGSLLVLGYIRHHHAEQIAETLASTQAMIDEERIEDMSGMLEHIEKDLPNVAKNPKVFAKMEEMKSLIALDKKRAEDFQRNLSQADGLLGEQPDLTILSQIKKSFLDPAEKLNRTTEEKTAFGVVKRKYEVILQQAIREIDKDFSESLNKISVDLDALGRNSVLPPSEVLNALKELDRRIKKLMLESKGISDEMQAQGKNLESRIANHQADKEHELRLARAKTDLSSAVPNWTKYRNALGKLGTEFSDEEAGYVLKGLDAVEEVAKALEGFATSFSQAAARDYKTLHQASGALKSKYEAATVRISGASSDFFQMGDILENLSKLTPDTRGAFATVESHLKMLSQRDLYPWVDEDMNWYYLTKKPTGAGKYKYVASYRGDEMDYTILASSFNATKIPVTIPYSFAAASLKKIDGIRDDAVAVVGDVMRDLFTREGDEPGIDPILQCVMMDLLITDMSKIDPFFASNFEELHRFVKSGDVERLTTWMDVKSNNTKPQRAKAVLAIKRFPEIQPLIDKTIQDRTVFMAKLDHFHPHFEWVGILLHHDYGGKWYCMSKADSFNYKSGDFYILRPHPVDKTVMPVKIGQANSGKIVLNDNTTSYIPYAPVFWVQK